MVEPSELALQPPPAVREICRQLIAAGHDVWAVGGAVRDALLGRPSQDWDLASSARPAELRRLFRRRTIPIGIEHGTVGVIGGDGVLYEVTTFRRDVKTDGRHAEVEFALSVEEDLARRDFTLNAIAWNPQSGRLYDPFHGLADLRAGILRTVGDPHQRFREDYLRVLRALRFAGHYDLTIETGTWRALVAAVPALNRLSAERVREELWKILSKTRRASVGLFLWAESGALGQLLPELAAVRDIPDDGADLWRATLAAVDALPPSRPLVRLATLFHDVGKPRARTRDLRAGWRYTGHERAGARTVVHVLRRLRFSNAETERVRRLVEIQSDLFPPDAPDAGVRRWLRDVQTAYVHDLFRLRFALWRAIPVTGGDRDLLERWRHAHRVLGAKPVLDVGGLAIDGHDLGALGLAPGPRYGEILQSLLERVLQDPELNRRETLLALLEQELQP